MRTRVGTPIVACRTPCRTCPWRVGQAGKHAGKLPDAIKGGATWGCHSAPVDSGGDSPRICAGFLASDDAERLDIIRFARAHGWVVDLTEQRRLIDEAGVEVFHSLAAMRAAGGSSA